MNKNVAVGILLAWASACHAQDMTAMNWPQIVADAKKEGQLTWYNWYSQDTLKAQVREFENTYGIKVTIPEGSASANISKLLADKGKSAGDIDVISISGGAFNTVAPESNFIGPLNNILPEGKSLKYAIEGVDSKGYGVAFWGNQSGIAYDSRRVKESELPRTVKQFSQFMEQHPQAVGFNIENGGSGPAFIEAMTRAIVPGFDVSRGDADMHSLASLQAAWEWFRQEKPNYIITASNADSITRLTGGEFLLVPAWEDYVVGLQNRGEVPESIKMYIPDFGMPGGGNMVAIPRNAPHRSAALLFIHWLTQPSTQKLLQEHYGIVPLTADNKSDTGLISKKDRAHATAWIPKPLGESVKKAFSDNVVLK